MRVIIIYKKFENITIQLIEEIKLIMREDMFLLYE